MPRFHAAGGTWDNPHWTSPIYICCRLPSLKGGDNERARSAPVANIGKVARRGDAGVGRAYAVRMGTRLLETGRHADSTAIDTSEDWHPPLNRMMP
jgi:hypothetical protein